MFPDTSTAVAGDVDPGELEPVSRPRLQRRSQRFREFVASRHIIPATDQSSATIKNENGKLIRCGLHAQLPNRATVKICDRKKIGARSVRDLQGVIARLHRISFRAEAIADDHGDDSAQKRPDLILKIDHRDTTIMRVTDILIGDDVSNAVRFWLRFSRRDREESGAAIAQGKLAAFHVCEIQWRRASLFEIGEGCERQERKQCCEKELKAATVHA